MVIGVGLARQLKAQVPPSSLLWKIEGNGLEKPSYLYGTIHLICLDDFFLSDGLKDALNKAEHIALELDIDDPQLAVKMQQLSMNPGGKNMADDLNEEDIKVINGFLKSSGPHPVRGC